MEKILHVGSVPVYDDKRGEVFITVKIENGKASFTGVIGPKRNGDCLGSCGQIVDELSNPELVPAKGWTPYRIERLAKLWKRWHLNDMHAGCEHQRANGWDKMKLDPEKGEGQGNMAIWTYKKDHPNGKLCEPCPQCGYKYGTAWLFEQLPENFEAIIASFPDSDIVPAWH